jgi:hypothetical protein
VGLVPRTGQETQTEATNDINMQSNQFFPFAKGLNA